MGEEIRLHDGPFSKIIRCCRVFDGCDLNVRM